jgi:mono/diheme cytochrome c family protein
MIRRLLPLLLTALLLAACGGGPEEPAVTTEDDQPPAEQPTSGEAGAQLFNSTCGGCHTLAAADTEGVVGPNLDELQPSREEVLGAIDSGPGAMPANLLQGPDAETVADFVAENAGDGG